MLIMLALLKPASPRGGIGTGERRSENIRGWLISNAIELPDLRGFYYINIFLDNSISSTNITYPKI